MILTPLNIQIAIIKAFYALAKKSVKYYTGLALGKNNTCLFKEIRLLRAYVDILRSFEIVGSVDACCCCFDGNYSFNEINININDLSSIQLLIDGTGTLVNLSGTYAITWGFQTGQLYIKLPNDTIINYSDTSFDSSCNIDFQEQSQGYSYLASIDVPTDYKIYDNAFGVMRVLLSNGVTVLKNIDYVPVTIGGTSAQKIIPSSTINSQGIADYWNAQLPTSNLNLQLSGSGLDFNMWINYFNNYDYTAHVFRYIYCITQPTATVSITEAAMFGGGSLTQSFIVDGNIIYTHNGVYLDYTDLVNGFNSNVTDYVMIYVSGTTIKITTALAVEGTIFAIDYYNPSYEDDEGVFTDPVFTTLEGLFAPSGLESSIYTNLNPCTPTVVTETCLTNNQVLKIIQHISKLIK